MINYILQDKNLNILYTTKKTPLSDGVFLRKIKENILGKTYDLHIYFVGEEKIKKINQKYRSKNYITDILSFPFLKDNFGEIYICEKKAIQKAKQFNTETKKYLEYLFVHGMIHLLGHDHGDEMDKLEKKYTKKLNIFYPY